MNFLENHNINAIPLKSDINGIEPKGLFLGQGNHSLEIILFSSKNKPNSSIFHRAFKERKGSRASPILVVILHNEGVSLAGTGGDKPPIFHTEDVSQAERLCEAALLLPDRNAAIRFLAETMPSIESPLSGISNEGLLSMHELNYGTRLRDDWKTATEKSIKILGKSRKDLITALGFNFQKLDNMTEILLSGDEKTALAVLLNDSEVPELSNDRFNNTSPVSYALAKADNEKLPWVVMVQGDRIRIYNTKNIGVGRRGRTETYIECQSSILSQKDAGLLWLLFSSDALKDGGTIDDLLEESQRFAADIADTLRERIYDIVIPKLAMGISKERNLTNPSKDQLTFTYQMALTVLFRLLFIAYAEDRDLLPYKHNEAYRKRSLKQKSLELAEAASKQAPISQGDHHWSEINLLWKAVFHGNIEWGVPAYDGTIFSTDEAVSPEGAAIAKITLPNNLFEEALRGLLLIESEDLSYAPVDFRALSVREFGTIYEGLLASELSLAKQNLTMKKNGIYLPAKNDEPVFIEKGEVYLHDQSGARKSSGSYYTPDFAVEHLLDNSLEPALDKHLARIKELDEADRSEQFFDFRVADIAMGSGHFLVAAIDRIERRFALWLDENPTPGITRELQRLRVAAKTQLGELAETVAIEDGQILRRMIARRCIYGVDYNPITVQLAQLSIWIHTFVPGLPLSLLDHNLVQGNSLVGVSSLDEIRSKFDESAGTLFEVNADELLGQAAEPLMKLARLSDASVTDIAVGRKLMQEARLKTLETEALCDLIIAQPVSDDYRLKGFAFDDWDRQRHKIQNSRALRLAKEILDPLTPLHFPIIFPEVFLGHAKGFNVLLGNPPWEEVKAEERDFWTRHFPGLRGLPQREQIIQWKILAQKRPDLKGEWEQLSKVTESLANILKTGKFPGLEVGDLDLYKAFAWRFWFLSSPIMGRIGVVMPRSALAAAGSAKFRRELMNEAEGLDIVTLQNTGKWVFDMEPRYTIALLGISRSAGEPKGISLKGPFTSMASFLEGKEIDAHRFSVDEVLNLNESASLPLLPEPYSAEVLLQLRKAPWLSLDEPDSWRARADSELHATAQKPLMDFSGTCPDGFWKVYKGESYDLWEPDKGQYYAWADPKKVIPWLQKKRLRANNGSRDSVHKEYTKEYVEDLKTLAPYSPRISFRLITNRTNRRTLICALTPANVLHANSSQVVMMPRGDKKDEAFLLGVLSSIPLDWYARRFVELNFNFYLFKPLPIPRADRSNRLWQRVVELSGRLACPDDRYAEWAKAVGVSYGSLEPDEKQDKIYELDAVVAHLYGLNEPQLTHIFETFHEGWNYKDRLSRVLKYFHSWSERT